MYGEGDHPVMFQMTERRAFPARAAWHKTGDATRNLAVDQIIQRLLINVVRLGERRDHRGVHTAERKPIHIILLGQISCEITSSSVYNPGLCFTNHIKAVMAPLANPCLFFARWVSSMVSASLSKTTVWVPQIPLP